MGMRSPAAVALPFPSHSPALAQPPCPWPGSRSSIEDQQVKERKDSSAQMLGEGVDHSLLFSVGMISWLLQSTGQREGFVSSDAPQGPEIQAQS